MSHGNLSSYLKLLPFLGEIKIKNQDKTKEQLMDELRELRKRIAVLEESETQHKQAEEVLQESKAGIPKYHLQRCSSDEKGRKAEDRDRGKG